MKRKFDIATVIAFPIFIIMFAIYIGTNIQSLSTNGFNTADVMSIIGNAFVIIIDLIALILTIPGLYKTQSKPIFIYLSHPYGGDEANLHKCTAIYKKLQPELYESKGQVLLSPLQSCGCLYNDMSYENGLSLSMELLKMCSEIWICPGWQASKGCRRERDYAYEHGITVRYLRSDEII